MTGEPILMLRCCSIGQHAANTAAWIGYVSGIARDEMDVNVHARLAAGTADIDADIVAVGGKLLLNLSLGTIKQRNYACFLFCRHIKKARYMSARNHENMAATQTIIIVAHIAKFIIEQHHVGLAQFTAPRIVRHHLIACGLIGEPVPPVMMSGGPQKKNS